MREDYMKTLAIILAGGKGTRLGSLVKDRCKPAVPFGGMFRIIDFVLSNCINSGIRQINVMVQYKSDSLQKHIRDGWNILSPALGHYIDVYPPQQRVSEKWYSGTADAIYQNLFTIENENPDFVLILSGDHIYKMDYREIIDYHIKKKADLTVATIPVTLEEGKEFGIIEIDKDYRILGFEEKPDNPKPTPENPHISLASMGIYVFSRKILEKQLIQDSETDSSHDFGKDIIPKMIDKYNVYSYPFQDDKGKPKYWKDVGTLDAYYKANIDLLKLDAEFDMYERNWPFRTFIKQGAAAKFFSYGDNYGMVINSIVANGVLVGGTVKNSIISPNVIIEKEAEVKDSIIFEDTIIGIGAKVKNAIIDKQVIIPDNYLVGYNLEEDKKKFVVNDKGIVVIPKGTKIN